MSGYIGLNVRFCRLLAIRHDELSQGNHMLCCVGIAGWQRPIGYTERFTQRLEVPRFGHALIGAQLLVFLEQGIDLVAVGLRQMWCVLIRLWLALAGLRRLCSNNPAGRRLLVGSRLVLLEVNILD